MDIRETDKVVYPELSYQIVGAAFRVFNALGFGHKEVFYQRALAEEFQKTNLKFQREVYFPLRYGTKRVGSYIADFVVEESIIVELKVQPMLGYAHMRQVMEYLQISGKRLAILVYFVRDGVRYRRVLPPRP